MLCYLWKICRNCWCHPLVQQRIYTVYSVDHVLLVTRWLILSSVYKSWQSIIVSLRAAEQLSLINCSIGYNNGLSQLIYTAHHLVTSRPSPSIYLFVCFRSSRIWQLVGSCCTEDRSRHNRSYKDCKCSPSDWQIRKFWRPQGQEWRL